jgi:hypothetical protein
MRILWKLLKVIIGLAIAIPLLVIALVVTLGILGTLFGLAIVALKLALLGLAGSAFEQGGSAITRVAEAGKRTPNRRRRSL